MTLKQGQEINQKFSNLNDSLSFLNNLLNQKKSEVVILNADKQKLDTNVFLLKNQVSISDKQIINLTDQLKKTNRQLDIERKQWAGWMFFSFVVTVIVGALK